MVEISTGILERYAADAAREIDGVRSVSKVKVASEKGAARVELRIAVAWGASIPTLGHNVQTRVREYLLHMADLEQATVDVIVDEIGPA